MELHDDIILTCKQMVINCRRAVLALAAQEPLNRIYLRTYKQCEDICLALLEAMAGRMPYLEKISLLCIGLCEECAEIGHFNQQRIFSETAATAKRLSHMLTQFLPYQQVQHKKTG